jgi:hypothetical protein
MSGTDKRKMVVIGKNAKTSMLYALRGLEWTVYQFCTMLTRTRG